MLAKLARPNELADDLGFRADRARHREAIRQQVVLRRFLGGVAENQHADVADEANGLNGLADPRPRRSPACPGRDAFVVSDSAPASRTGPERRPARRLAEKADLGADDDVLDVAVVSPLTSSRSASGAAGSRLGDRQPVVEAAVDLELGDRADADADAEQRQPQQVAVQARSRVLDIAA